MPFRAPHAENVNTQREFGIVFKQKMIEKLFKINSTHTLLIFSRMNTCHLHELNNYEFLQELLFLIFYSSQYNGWLT
jgi:hypothetical protein